jgi:hypothetical protein
MPLDRQGDREYQQAIAELESAEVPLDMIAEVIPVGIPVPPKRCSVRRPCADAAASDASTLDLLKPLGTRFRRLIGLGVLFVIGLGLGALIAFFLTR